MAEVDWSILCEHAIVDKQTNSMSMFKVIETIRANPKSEGAEDAAEKTTQVGLVNGWMLIPIPSQLVTLFTRTDPEIPEVVEARVGCIGPDNQEYDNKIGIDVILNDHVRSRNMLTMETLPIAADGKHHFTIEIKSNDETWVEAFRVPFYVDAPNLAKEIKRLESTLPVPAA